MNIRTFFFAAGLLVLTSSAGSAQTNVSPAEGNFTVRGFKFESGESLPELKLHYRTLGSPRRDAAGVVRNAVLVLHGTGGSGAAFLSEQFGGELSNRDNSSTRASISLCCPTA